MKSILRLSLLLAAAVSMTGQAFAFPRIGEAKFIPESTATVDFDGILAIRELTGGCSASLVRYETSKADDKALVLTNGHCYEGGFLKAGQYLVDKKSSRKFKVLEPKGGRSDIGSIRAERILYATMTKTDITLYRVKSTYAEIESKFGVHPLTLATSSPDAGIAIEIASGYWERGYACNLESIVPTLKEGDWTWRTSLRYSRPGCETIGGTSGSPVVQTGTRIQVGINNTGNEDGQKCTENNPCEIDRDGNVVYEKGVSYGQQIYWIYSCLDKDLNFDLGQENCALPGGKLAASN